MNHKCPIQNCTAKVPGNKLMCPHHWGMVPSDLGSAVYREYRRAPYSLAHHQAMRAAIDAVNRIGQTGPSQEAQ